MNAVLKLCGLACLAAFLCTIAWFVPAPELIIVFGFCFALAVFDFWFFRGSRG